MEYKLFDDYITLQALLKNLGIIQSGGAIKFYLSETTILFNGQEENRRGKKIRLGDRITIPSQNIDITVVSPTTTEIAEHQKNLAEKQRVAAIVKSLNKDNKKQKNKNKNNTNQNVKPIRFPGT